MYSCICKIRYNFKSVNIYRLNTREHRVLYKRFYNPIFIYIIFMTFSLIKTKYYFISKIEKLIKLTKRT